MASTLVSQSRGVVHNGASYGLWLLGNRPQGGLSPTDQRSHWQLFVMDVLFVPNGVSITVIAALAGRVFLQRVRLVVRDVFS
jgi:hypothetical protein